MHLLHEAFVTSQCFYVGFWVHEIQALWWQCY